MGFILSLSYANTRKKIPYIPFYYHNLAKSVNIQFLVFLFLIKLDASVAKVWRGKWIDSIYKIQCGKKKANNNKKNDR